MARNRIVIGDIASEDPVHLKMAVSFDAIEAMSKLLHSMKNSNVSSMLVPSKNGITKYTVIVKWNHKRHSSLLKVAAMCDQQGC